MALCPEQPRSVHEILRQHALDRGDEYAVVDGVRRLTYRELSEQVDRLAEILVANGVSHGDRVATLAVPGVDFWTSFLAATSIGAIWLGLNPKYRGPEIAHVLQDAAPTIVLVQSQIEGRDMAAEFQELGFPKQQLLSFADHPILQSIDADDQDGKADGIDLAQIRQDVEAEDIALIVYTSGTTGRPKGAMLSHRAVVASARINSSWMAGRISSTICAAPINHVGAVNNRCMVVFYAGGKITFMPRPDYSRLEALIAAEGCTFHHFNPTTLAMLLDHPA
ncbi:MAG: acyl--CoA ligase, partial [Sphingomonadaceae bacterium]|nr:acyl--CoA ligase [Sphingomonadaceae bacterium]